MQSLMHAMDQIEACDEVHEMEKAVAQAITLLALTETHLKFNAKNEEYSQTFTESFNFGFSLLAQHVRGELLKHSDNVRDMVYEKLASPHDAGQNGAAVAQKAGAVA